MHFRPDGVVEVRHCWTEMGQGVHTVAQQVAVEELGVSAEQIEVIVDSTRELGAGQTTGSRGTLMGAGSVADACRKALADGCRVGVDYVGEYRVDWTNSLDEGVVNPIIHSTFGYAAQLVIMNEEGVEKVVAAHDVGRAVNPLLCEGQVEGAVHMGLGYAFSEGFPVRPRWSAAEHDPAQSRHHPSQGHARRRDDPGRVARNRTRPTASRASAKSAWSRRPGRWRRPCTPATDSGATNSHSSTKRTAKGLTHGDDTGVVG